MITVMSTSMDELIERFRLESSERFGDIQRLLGKLVAQDDAAEVSDAIRDHAHKLKGAAGVLGFPEMKDRAAELEEVSASQAAAADGATAAGAISPAVDALGAVLPAE
jgi:HPt (histidine-containing phosphotransfer) domain-containing protein